MIWADPSANPVLVARRRASPGWAATSCGSAATRSASSCEAGVLPGQPRGGRGAGRPARAPASEGDQSAAAARRLRRRRVQRLRRLRRSARARPRARRARTSPTARSAASLPSATTAWSSTATPSTSPATEARRAAIRAERLDGAAAFGDGERLGTVDRGAVLVPGAAGGVDVAEHDGARVWACSACGEHLGPMGGELQAPHALPAACAADRRRPAVSRSDGVLRDAARCCASTRARAARRCSPRSSASPTTRRGTTSRST